jgi:hypothetical protein
VEVLLGRVDKQSVGVETLITNRTHLTQIYESFFSASLTHLQCKIVLTLQASEL